MLGRGPLKHINKSLQIKWTLSHVTLISVRKYEDRSITISITIEIIIIIINLIKILTLLLYY